MNNFDLLGKHISEMDDVLDRWVEKLGIGYNHFAVLYELAAAENGQCTQKQICEEWYLPKQTVFNICKEYREKGWIEFFESAQDKRERIMRLTEIGKKQAEPIYAHSVSLFESAFDTFGKENTAKLFKLMDEFNQVCKQKIQQFEIK